MKRKKNNQVVLDASAILALLNNEPGADRVESVLPYSIISAVNLAEIVVISLKQGLEEQMIRPLLLTLIPSIIPFSEEQAYVAGGFYSVTHPYGLSLGDRACLALASQYKLPVLTGDKIWAKIDIGVEVQLIR